MNEAKERNSANKDYEFKCLTRGIFNTGNWRPMYVQVLSTVQKGMAAPLKHQSAFCPSMSRSISQHRSHSPPPNHQ